MIAANELRIGNEVFYSGAYCTVVGLPFGSTTLELAGCEGFISVTDTDPIPLSPEILEKCGFVTPDMYQETVKINDVVMLDIHKGKILLRDNRRIELLYLHQLQNLYFSLVGTELTVNL